MSKSLDRDIEMLRERGLLTTESGTPESIELLAEYLLALLQGPFYVLERDGELHLMEGKALVAQVKGLKIEIYPDEHPPPHFHVRTPETNASFRIDDCSPLAGELNGRDYKLVRLWHRNSKKLLTRKWNEMRPTDCSVGNYRDF